MGVVTSLQGYDQKSRILEVNIKDQCKHHVCAIEVHERVFRPATYEYQLMA